MKHYLVLPLALLFLFGCTTQKRSLPENTGPKLMHLSNETQQKICDDGNIEACIYTALNQIHGREVLMDVAAGQKKIDGYLEKVSKECDAQNGYSCYLEGIIELNISQKPNFEAVIDLFQTACEHKVPHGCFIAGILSKKRQKRDRFFKTGCYLKNGYACTKLGTLLLQHPNTINRGIMQLQDTCSDSQMDSVSCFLLGDYFQKKGDLKNAYDYYYIGCKHKDPLSCIHLGLLGDDIDLQTMQLLKGCKYLVYHDHRSSCLNFNITPHSLRQELTLQLKDLCQKQPLSWSCNALEWHQKNKPKKIEKNDQQSLKERSETEKNSEKKDQKINSITIKTEKNIDRPQAGAQGDTGTATKSGNQNSDQVTPKIRRTGTQQ